MVEEELGKTRVEEEKQRQLQNIQSLYRPKNTFIKILNNLFKDTAKSFDEKTFEFNRFGYGTPIIPQYLSSGEKQVLIILLTALLQNGKPFIMMMDEPEISLHIDWQRQLINNIREINPQCQILIATHSPNIHYHSWADKQFSLDTMLSPAGSAQMPFMEHGKENNLQELEDRLMRLEGNKATQLYNFNRILNNYTAFTKQEYYELLKLLDKIGLSPDIKTYTILISKLNSFEDAKELYKNIIHSKSLNLLRDNRLLNVLIKKAGNVTEGIKLIQEAGSDAISLLYPDITSFNILMGKATSTVDVIKIEEARNFYGIKPNDIYKNKLKFRK